jgi:hypothetical protein
MHMQAAALNVKRNDTQFIIELEASGNYFVIIQNSLLQHSGIRCPTRVGLQARNAAVMSYATTQFRHEEQYRQFVATAIVLKIESCFKRGGRRVTLSLH